MTPESMQAGKQSTQPWAQRAQGLTRLLVQGGGSFPSPWAVPESLMQNTATNKEAAEHTKTAGV